MTYNKKIGFFLSKEEDYFYLTNGVNLYKINEVGARIYDLCNGKRNIDEISIMISKFYNVDFVKVKNDTEKYINLLLDIDAIYNVEGE